MENLMGAEFAFVFCKAKLSNKYIKMQHLSVDTVRACDNEITLRALLRTMVSINATVAGVSSRYNNNGFIQGVR